MANGGKQVSEASHLDGPCAQAWCKTSSKSAPIHQAACTTQATHSLQSLMMQSHLCTIFDAIECVQYPGNPRHIKWLNRHRWSLSCQRAEFILSGSQCSGSLGMAAQLTSDPISPRAHKDTQCAALPFNE